MNILERPGKSILVESNGRELTYTRWGELFYKKPKVLDGKVLEAYWPNQVKRKPGKRHPWR